MAFWIALLSGLILCLIGCLLFCIRKLLEFLPQNHIYFKYFAAVACDHIWFARNKALHENLIPNALDISSRINRIALNHHSAWNAKLVPHLAVWSAPITPFYKINYDTAIRPSF